MLYTFHVLRTNWKESVDFREKVLGWLQLTTGISFVGLNKEWLWIGQYYANCIQGHKIKKLAALVRITYFGNKKICQVYLQQRQFRIIDIRLRPLESGYFWKSKTFFIRIGLLSRGGGYSTSVYTGRLHPEGSTPYLFTYLFFFERGTSFVYLPLTNGTPFTYLV